MTGSGFSRLGRNYRRGNQPVAMLASSWLPLRGFEAAISTGKGKAGRGRVVNKGMVILEARRKKGKAKKKSEFGSYYVTFVHLYSALTFCFVSSSVLLLSSAILVLASLSSWYTPVHSGSGAEISVAPETKADILLRSVVAGASA